MKKTVFQIFVLLLLVVAVPVCYVVAAPNSRLGQALGVSTLLSSDPAADNQEQPTGDVDTLSPTAPESPDLTGGATPTVDPNAPDVTGGATSIDAPDVTGSATIVADDEDENEDLDEDQDDDEDEQAVLSPAPTHEAEDEEHESYEEHDGEEADD